MHHRNLDGGGDLFSCRMMTGKAVREKRSAGAAVKLRSILAAATFAFAATAFNTQTRAAPADAAASVRSGNHPDFGRLVIDAGGKTSFKLDQDGDTAVLHLMTGTALGPAPARPRNVASLAVSGSDLDLVIRQGAKLRAKRINGRIVLDIFDPPADAPQEAPRPVLHKPATKPLPSMATSPETGGRAPRQVALARPPVQTAPLAPPTNSANAVAVANIQSQSVETARQIAPGRDTLPEIEGPLGLRVRRTRLPEDQDGSAFLVPLEATTSAAAFESMHATVIVFDERRPVDMAGLTDDPVFSAASVRLLPNGTVFSVPHKAGVSIVLTPLPRGWRIAALKVTATQQPISTTLTDGRLDFAAEQAGEVVSMADPDTGATLLIGTQHRPGQGIATARTTPEFILRPTSQGVVVEPLSDSIAFRRTPTGFTLSGGPKGLAMSPQTDLTAALMDAAHMTSRLRLPTMPREALLRLAIRQLDDAAATPPRARGPKHRAAAESFLALGMAAEAESLLRMAAEEDPNEAASPDTEALTAIAALLAGRPEEASGILDPKLDGTDEIALWRGIRQAMEDEGSPAAAAVIAAAGALAFQYPEAIRQHILPLMTETMIEGGALPAASRLLALAKDAPHLDYARALMRQADGDTPQALTMLDALAAGRDQFDRARAAVRAVELRLSSGAIDKAKAADALDKLLYAWRGDSRELELRERIADLRAQTGAWRTALSTLRQAQTDFPEQAVSIHQRLKDTLRGMIHDPATDTLPPLEFIAAIEENSDLLNDAAGDLEVDAPLAERLLALDLPGRAKPILQKLVQQTQSPIAKARYGATLATLDARDGDDTGALAALDATQASDLPDDLSEQRLILRGETLAHHGDLAAGAALLAAAKDPRATQARAQMLETAGDWPAAEQAWIDCVGQTLPDSGALNEAQSRMVLHLATATARAADAAGLATLRGRFDTRIGAGPLGDMFRLLTAAPIQTIADIRRSHAETNMAASLPDDMNALQPSTVAR